MTPAPSSTNAPGGGEEPLAQAPGDGAQHDPLKKAEQEVGGEGQVGCGLEPGVRKRHMLVSQHAGGCDFEPPL